jgi:hypothetical protein
MAKQAAPRTSSASLTQRNAAIPIEQHPRVNAVAPLRERLTLNVAPIGFSTPAITVGRLSGLSEDAYRELRERHRGKYTLRYDKRDRHVYAVALDSNAIPLGEAVEVIVADHLLLFGKAVQQALLRWLSSRRTILRPAKPLQCWGNRKAALLSAAIREVNLVPRPGLDVLVRHSFDTRVLQAPGDERSPFLALVLDVGTSNEINMTRNLPPFGIASREPLYQPAR